WEPKKYKRKNHPLSSTIFADNIIKQVFVTFFMKCFYRIFAFILTLANINAQTKNTITILDFEGRV
ncbi:uncharacterized protein METZ01_LOCUS258785, partial [marine metagenome]